MFDDSALFYDTVAKLRDDPTVRGVRASREHYLYLAKKIELLNSEVASVKAAIAQTAGGYVDGQPTGSHNFLQRIRALRNALDLSVNLQSHYANLLNMHDGGGRLQFKDGEEWIARLAALSGIASS